MEFTWIIVLSVVLASLAKGENQLENGQALDTGAEMLYSLLQVAEAAPVTKIVPMPLMSDDSKDIPVNSAEEDPVELSKDYSQDLALGTEKSESVDVDFPSEEDSHESETVNTDDKNNLELSDKDNTSEEVDVTKNDNELSSASVPTLPTPLPVLYPPSTDSQAKTTNKNDRLLPRRPLPKLVAVSSKQLPPVRAPVFHPRPNLAPVPFPKNQSKFKAQEPQGKSIGSSSTSHTVNTAEDLDSHVTAHELEELELLTEMKYANSDKTQSSQEYQEISPDQQSHETNVESFDLMSLETSDADASTEIFYSNMTDPSTATGEQSKVTSISFSVEQSEEVKDKDILPAHLPNVSSSASESTPTKSESDKDKFVISSVQTSKSVEESEVVGSSGHEGSEEEESDEIDQATEISMATNVSDNSQSTVVYQSFQTSMSISKSVSESEKNKMSDSKESDQPQSPINGAFTTPPNAEESPIMQSTISNSGSTAVSKEYFTPDTSVQENIGSTTTKSLVTQISHKSETSLATSGIENRTHKATSNTEDSSFERSLFDWSGKSLSGTFYDRISGRNISLGKKDQYSTDKTVLETSAVSTASSTLQSEAPIGKSVKTSPAKQNSSSLLSLPTEDPNILAKLLPESFSTEDPKTTVKSLPKALPTEDPSILAKLLPKSFPTEDPSILAKMLPKSYPTEDPSVLAKMLPKSFPTEDPSILAKMLPKSFPTEDPSILAKMLPKSFPTEDPSVLAKLLPKSFPTEDPNILAKLLPQSYQTSTSSSISTTEKNEKVFRTFFDKATGKNITIPVLTEDPKILAAFTPSPRNKTETDNTPPVQVRTVFNKALGRNITIQIMTEDPSILAAMTPPSTSASKDSSSNGLPPTSDTASTGQTTPTQTMRSLGVKQIGKLPIITRNNVTRKPFLPVRSSTKNPRPPPTFKKMADFFNRSRTVPLKRQYGRQQSYEGRYQDDPEKRFTAGDAVMTTTTIRTTTTLSPYFRWGRSLVLSGNLKIIDGLDWMEELRDATTSQFKKVANEIEGSLYNLFKKNSVIGSKFKGVQIEGFSKGVLVDYTVFLNEDTKGSVPQMLKESYRDGLGNGTYLGALKVDPLYVDFRVVKQEEIHAPDAEEDNQTFPYWAIAIVGIGAACLLFLTVLLIVKSYNKRSVRRKYGSPLTEDSIQDRRKSLEKQAYHNAGAEGLYDLGSMGELWTEKKPKKNGSSSTYSNQRNGLYGSNQIYQGGNVYSTSPYQTTDLFAKDHYQSDHYQPANPAYQSYQNPSKYYDSWNEWDEPPYGGSQRSRTSYKRDYDTTF